LTGASANATLNAQLVTVRSPLAGDISMQHRMFGARLRVGELVATVNDPLVDAVRLDDLELERSLAEAEIARLSGLRDETGLIMSRLQDRAERYRSDRISELETRLSFARARLEILEGQQAADGLPSDTASAISEDGQRAPLEPDLPELWVSYARERVEVLEVALRAARAGVFLGDGYNDSPNAEQRLTELHSEMAGLSAQFLEAEARLQAMTARHEAERRRVNLFRGVEMRSPVDGLVWEVLAADGENVQRGDQVVRILDCETTVVSLSVTESVFNDLSIGDPATFRPRGSGLNFEGTVARLAGVGAATVYRNMAVAPSQQHLERFDVTLAVPDLQNDPEFECAVGRTGRVFFDRRPLDWLRRIWE
jgi:multidrug resistance efflux pump